MIRVFIADSHPIMREGLRSVIERTADMTVVGESTTGADLVRLACKHAPHILLLDLSLPGRKGLEVLRQLHTDVPRLRVMVLTSHAEAHDVLRAFRWGAAGYLTKECTAEELLAALRKLSTGGTYVGPAAAASLANGVQEHFAEAPHTSLSDRELEVFRQIVNGQSLTDIAEALHVSAKTVSTYKMRLLIKLGLHSDAALVRYAIEAKLFEDSPS